MNLIFMNSILKQAEEAIVQNQTTRRKCKNVPCILLHWKFLRPKNWTFSFMNGCRQIFKTNSILSSHNDQEKKNNKRNKRILLQLIVLKIKWKLKTIFVGKIRENLNKEGLPHVGNLLPQVITIHSYESL